MKAHWFTATYYKVQVCTLKSAVLQRTSNLVRSVSGTPSGRTGELQPVCCTQFILRVYCRDVFMHLIRTFLIRTCNVSWIRKLDLKSRLVLEDICVLSCLSPLQLLLYNAAWQCSVRGGKLHWRSELDQREPFFYMVRVGVLWWVPLLILPLTFLFVEKRLLLCNRMEWWRWALTQECEP